MDVFESATIIRRRQNASDAPSHREPCSPMSGRGRLSWWKLGQEVMSHRSSSCPRRSPLAAPSSSAQGAAVHLPALGVSRTVGVFARGSVLAMSFGPARQETGGTRMTSFRRTVGSCTAAPRMANAQFPSQRRSKAPLQMLQAPLIWKMSIIAMILGLGLKLWMENFFFFLSIRTCDRLRIHDENK